MARGVNFEYKDRLFKFIFGNPEHKEWTLSLYNAMNGTRYADENAIEINTIDDVVYLGMKNDVSFLIDNTLNLYEQQSRFNPNMPMRFVIYAGMLCSKYAQDNRSQCNLHTPKLKRFPTPRFVCFYNGTERKGNMELKLSSMFAPGVESSLEATVQMIDVNCEENRLLLNACRPLNDYTFFVNQVVTYKLTMELKDAVSKALNDLPDDSPIKGFLMSNKAEITRMCITEYDEKETLALEREEGREEGRAEGRAEGLEEGREEGLEEGRVEGRIEALKAAAKNLYNQGYPVEKIASAFDVSVVDVKIWLNDVE